MMMAMIDGRLEISRTMETTGMFLNILPLISIFGLSRKQLTTFYPKTKSLVRISS